MSSKTKNEDIFLNIALELRDSRENFEKTTKCLGCSDSIKLNKFGSFMICANCFDKECEWYYKQASNEQWEDEIDKIYILDDK